MTTRSLILSPHEVRAALDGRLGLVVRPVKPQPIESDDIDGLRWRYRDEPDWPCPHNCPLGVPGDRLRCKETWADVNTDSGPAFTYRSDHGLHFCQDDAFPVEYDRYPGMSFAMWCGDLWRGEPGHTWRRAQHMPAWASRITLEVVGVRCVRFGELSHVDARLCGFIDDGLGHFIPMQHFWNAKYAKHGLGWEKNPWAWAAEVRRGEG